MTYRMNQGRAGMTSIRLSNDKEPPSEIRLWAYGEIETSHGTFHLSKENAEKIVQNANEWGNDLHFDYEHASLDQELRAKGDAPAAGWFRLEARDDGLYAVGIEWTEKAAQGIKNSEFKYFSPAFWVDEDGYIVEVVNVAVTNSPATHNMQPLMSDLIAANVRSRKMPRDKRIAASLPLMDLLKKLGEAIRIVTDWDGYIEEVFTDHVIFYYRDALYKIPYSVDGETITVSGDAVEVKHEFVEVDGGNTMKTLLVTLGLAAGASENDGVERAQKLVSASEQLLKLTGAQDAESALGTVSAWKNSHERLEQLEAQMATEREKREKEERENLITTGMTEGKIPPAQREFWETQPLPALKQFLATALPVSGVEPSKDTNKPGKPADNDSEDLTKDPLFQEVAANFGNDASKVADFIKTGKTEPQPKNA